MRKIILNLAVTLDGFIEGPNGEIDWLRMDTPPDADPGEESHFDQLFERIDTIFYGRISYEKWGEYQPADDAPLPEKKLWQGVHSKTKYVFSKSLKGEDKNVTFIHSDIEDKVHRIKEQPGKDIWLYGGAGLITSFMNLGLVDNYLLAVYPVILGDGKPLFSNLRNRVGLRLNRVVSSGSGVILLDYDTVRNDSS